MHIGFEYWFLQTKKDADKTYSCFIGICLADVLQRTSRSAVYAAASSDDGSSRRYSLRRYHGLEWALFQSGHALSRLLIYLFNCYALVCSGSTTSITFTWRVFWYFTIATPHLQHRFLAFPLESLYAIISSEQFGQYHFCGFTLYPSTLQLLSYI